MQPTIIGIIVVLLGCYALMRHEQVALKISMALSLLGSAAAINLPALGGASILAGPFFTIFVVLRNLMTRQGLLRFLSAFRLGAPGFWLLLAVGYGVFAAFFIAPFFYGTIMVYPISRGGADGAAFAQELFRMQSGNLTQSVYAIGQVMLYGSVTALMVTRRSHAAALNMLVLLGVAHVAVSMLDVLTYYSGTAALLDWLRTASYTSWTDNAIGGLKRISGLFPEASMYSIYAMAILGVSLRLMLSGYRTRVTRPVFYLTLLLLLLSTSTTAYAALAVATALLALLAFKDAAFLANFRILRVICLCCAGLGFAVVAALALMPGVQDQVMTIIDETLLNKMASDSGRDRSNLNAGAFQTFLDTQMLGAGIGSVRTSSFVMTLLSNLGLIGSVAYLLFIASLFGRDRSLAGCDPTTLILARAARWGVVANLIAASVSYHVFDLGPLFYVLAALSHPRLLVFAMVPRRAPRFPLLAAK